MSGVTELASTVSISAQDITASHTGNGHGSGYGHPVFEIEERPAFSLLTYLPAIYSADPFVGRFLRIFEDVLQPIQVMVDNQPYYFDPMTAPFGMLEWMAMWVDLKEGDDWTMRKRRALVAAAAALYRMRGTGAGIKKHLGIYAGGLTLLQERTNGFRLGEDARLGLNTSIGEDRPWVFTVTVAVPDPQSLDEDTLRAIIEADKPVEAGYVLRVVKLEHVGNPGRARPPVEALPQGDSN